MNLHLLRKLRELNSLLVLLNTKGLALHNSYVHEFSAWKIAVTLPFQVCVSILIKLGYLLLT